MSVINLLIFYAEAAACAASVALYASGGAVWWLGFSVWCGLIALGNLGFALLEPRR